MECKLCLVVICALTATATYASSFSKDPETTTELVAANGAHCSCQKQPKPHCGCCTRIKFHVFSIKINDEVCVIGSALPSKIGIEFAVTWDGKDVFKKDITVKNPPPLCFGLPFIHKLDVCLQIDNVSFQPHHQGACVELKIKLLFLKKTFKLGCFYGDTADQNGIQQAQIKVLKEILAMEAIELLDTGTAQRFSMPQHEKQAGDGIVALPESRQDLGDDVIEPSEDLFPPQKDPETTTELVAANGAHCSCHKQPKPHCGCCIRIKFHVFRIKIDDEVCVIGSALPSKIGIEFAVTWDGKDVFKKDITVKNPPPLCFGVPFIHELDACLQIDHVSFEPHHHGACVELKIKLLFLKKTFKLGCFYGDTADQNGIQQAQIKALKEILAMELWQRLDTGTAQRFSMPQHEKQTGDGRVALPETRQELGDDVIEPGDVQEYAEDLFPLQKDTTDQLGNTEFPDAKPMSLDVSRSGHCKCRKSCECCLKIFKLRLKVCGKIKFGTKKSRKGLWVSLKIRNRWSYSKFIPAKSEDKAICAKVKVHHLKATLCLHLKHVTVGKHDVSGCSYLYIKASFIRYRFKLGCFHTGIESRKPLPPMEFKGDEPVYSGLLLK